jgi:hypothetical protein
MSGEPAQVPTRATLVKWLRLNLALVLFVTGMVTSISGGLITGTLSVAHYDTRVTDMERSVSALERDRTERDERRIKLAKDLSQINDKLDTIAKQNEFVGKWIDDNFPRQPRTAKPR